MATGQALDRQPAIGEQPVVPPPADGGGPPPWKLLVVDDEADIHNITRLVLRFFKFKERGLEIIDAYSAAEARQQILLHPDVAVILLDVVMESPDAGLRFVETLREELNLHLPRIILRTGQPGYAPEGDVIRKYDINDYHTKTELTVSRLITVLTASLRSFDSLSTIEAMRRDLEKTVAERTSELAASNALKDQLFAVIAHDLRGPVGNVKAFLDILMTSDRLEYETIQKEFLEVMRDNASAVLNLLDNLLFWARFQQHALVADQRVQDLVPVIADVGRIWSVTARKKDVDLAIDAPVRADCRFDHTMISLVVRNLVGNALKFTPSGGRVGISLRPAPGGAWALEVSDTGIGIEPARLERLRSGLYDRSTRGTADESGSGLGLMLCRDFVAQHGSTLSIASTPGQGSRFGFTLPAPPSSTKDHE